MPSPASTLLEAYGVGLTQVGGGPWRLLGSGTLVTDGTAHAILTSIEVASQLPSSGRVGIVLRSDLNRITVARSDLAISWPGDFPEGGSSIVPIGLAPEVTRRIADVKRFYDLRSPPPHDDGCWYLHGYINELVVTALPLDCFDLIYNFDSLTVRAELTDAGDAPGVLSLTTVSADGVPIPADLSGLKGGGVWQVRSVSTPGILDARLVGIVREPGAGKFIQLERGAQLFRI